MVGLLRLLEGHERLAGGDVAAAVVVVAEG